jgi:hypothetical protein
MSDKIINFPPKETVAALEEVRLEKYHIDEERDISLLVFNFRMPNGKIRKASIVCQVSDE